MTAATPARKAAAKKTAARKRAPTKAAPRDRLPKGGEAAAAEPKLYEPGDALGDVLVPLSSNGEHTGKHKTLHPIAPTSDQMAWAEAAFYRMNLAMKAAADGEEFDQDERGRVFSEIRRLTGVFLSGWETDWCEDALSSGKVQLGDMWTAMADAFTEVGGVPINPDGEGANAEITVGS
jgi:hypothetical protein